jgi:diguanylate cyclase (GGDEF)-like protein
MLLLVTIVIFITYNVNIVQNEIRENQYNTLINNLRQDTTNFGLWISHKISIVDTAKDMTNNFSLDELKKWHTGNPYLNINNDDPSISQIYLGLADGDFITGGQWIPPEDYDPRTRTWYLEAVEANDTIVSKVYIDRETNDYLVTVSSPFYIEGDFVGVISADVFLDDIYDFIKNQMDDGESYSYLIDSTGLIVIYTSRPDLEGKNLFTDIDAPGLLEYFDEVQYTNDIVRMEYTYKGEPIRGIVQKVDGRKWYLAVAKVYDKSIFNIDGVGKWTLVINSLSLLIILILIYMIIKVRGELNSTNEVLKNENEKDFLTGIYNRRYLNLYLEKLWNIANPELNISMLIMDVDYFKFYNDTYGHIKGDEVLKAITKCINQNIRKGDVFARFGGEEFALVLENVTLEESKHIANKVKQAVYDLNIEHQSSPMERITISVGIRAFSMDSSLSVRQVIDEADKALYEAKESGRNAIMAFDDIKE